MTQQLAGNEFDAAKTIVEALKGLDQDQQDRAIRFASESVGLHSGSTRSNAGGRPLSGVPDATPLASPLQQVDIKQFVDSKSPRSDQQFATVVAYFYRFEAPEDQRKDAINSKDLNDAARLVGRKRPADATSTLNNAKNSGYLDSVGKGNFEINSVGENLVAITLPNNISERESVRSNGAKKKKIKKEASKKLASKGNK